MEELENKGTEHHSDSDDRGGSDNDRQEIFSRTVRAEKRTYFLM
ncbi:MAG: hypothetical protein R2759_20260 [Bacteroidales bacterium]